MSDLYWWSALRMYASCVLTAAMCGLTVAAWRWPDMTDAHRGFLVAMGAGMMLLALIAIALHVAAFGYLIAIS